MFKLPNRDTRKKLRNSLKGSSDPNESVNFFTYFLSIIAAGFLIGLAIYIPKQLVGTSWEWLAVKIEESHLWKTIYGITFCFAGFVVTAIVISIYEFISDRF
ncbi:MAG: hypothetical protein Aureis2KO_22660 [Aureisphaera sp.]